MLFDDLRANDTKGLFVSNDNFVNYSTGLLPLDYANGFWKTERDRSSGREIRVPIPGILGGKLILCFGATGSGKSTLSIQMAYSIIKPFSNGLVQYIDCEQTGLKGRIGQFTGLTQEDPRMILNVDHTAVEDVLEIIDAICEAKERGGDKYMYTPPHGT